MGQPRTQARAHLDSSRSSGMGVHIWTPGTADAWKAAVIEAGSAVRPHFPLQGEVAIELDFYLPRPQRLMRKRDPEGVVWCPKLPDIDNIIKAVLDAMTDDGWWKDDGQICGLIARKRYHGKQGSPGATIEVYGQSEAAP